MLGQTTPRNAKKSAILEIRKILDRGEKLVVCAGSKTWADNLMYNLFEEGAPLDIKYAYYHGLLPDDQLKAALQNVEKAPLRGSCALHSCTILVRPTATWLTLDLLVFFIYSRIQNIHKSIYDSNDMQVAEQDVKKTQRCYIDARQQ